MHPVEAASIVALTLAAALALIILPKPKPEPSQVEKQPPVETVIESQDDRPATQRAEPLTDAQRVDNLSESLDGLEADVRELKALVRLQQAIKGSPDEPEGKRREK